MQNEQSAEVRRQTEEQRDAERLAEFCAVWLEGASDQNEVLSAIFAFLALQLDVKDDSAK